MGRILDWTKKGKNVAHIIIYMIFYSFIVLLLVCFNYTGCTRNITQSNLTQLHMSKPNLTQQAWKLYWLKLKILKFTLDTALSIC